MAPTLKRPMRDYRSLHGTVQLYGEDAVELYLAEIDCNLATIDAQLVLLRAAFVERQKLRQELAGRVANAAPPSGLS